MPRAPPPPVLNGLPGASEVSKSPTPDRVQGDAGRPAARRSCGSAGEGGGTGEEQRGHGDVVRGRRGGCGTARGARTSGAGG